MEEDISIEAIVGAEALDDAETVTITMISNPISYPVLNSSNPQPKTKTSYPNIPQNTLNHLNMTRLSLYIDPVMPSTKPTSLT